MTLSVQIKKVEAAVRAALFKRTARRVPVTDEGERFVNLVQRVVAEARDEARLGRAEAVFRIHRRRPGQQRVEEVVITCGKCSRAESDDLALKRRGDGQPAGLDLTKWSETARAALRSKLRQGRIHG